MELQFLPGSFSILLCERARIKIFLNWYPCYRRDNRLYRAEYDTFEQYCRERWSFKRDYANKLIASSKVIENLNTIVSKPVTESQARPLSKLPAKEQKEVWQEAVETAPGGKATDKQWVGD